MAVRATLTTTLVPVQAVSITTDLDTALAFSDALNSIILHPNFGSLPAEQRAAVEAFWAEAVEARADLGV